MPSLYGFTSNANVRVGNTTGLYQQPGGSVAVLSSAQVLLNNLSQNGNVNFALDPAYGNTKVLAYTADNGVAAGTYGSGTQIPVVTVTGDGRVSDVTLVTVDPSVANYGNANVAAYLPTYTGSLENSSSVVSLRANAVAQQSSIDNLDAEYTSLNSTVISQGTAIGVLQSNAATQAGQIATLQSNAGVQADAITALQSNAATQQGEINSKAAISGQVFTGNVAVDAGHYFIGDGSQLTGLPSGSVTLTGNVTGSGTTGSPINTTIAASGVTPGTYGSDNAVPVITVGVDGRVTTVTTQPIGGGGGDYGNANVQAYLPTYTGSLELSSSIINLWANAATQASQIAGANAAIVTANTAMKGYVDAQDSAITSAWTANAATQQGQIDSLQSNTASQQSEIIALQSNAASQQGQIDSLQSNAASQQGEIISLQSNAASQQGEIISLQSNAASQQGQIDSLFSNAAAQQSGIDSVTDELHSFETWANLNFSTSTYSNTNVAAYLPGYTGDIGNSTTPAGVGYFQRLENIQAITANPLGMTLSAASGGIQVLSGTTPVAIGDFLQPTPLTVKGNITADSGAYFIGDGSQLTNLPIQDGTYSNTNVAAYLTTASIATTGNISANKFVSSYFDASGSGGGSLRNASGTALIQWGGGGGTNITISGATNINPANAQVDISPTGTGSVNIHPVGSLDISPVSVGRMNNVVIGNVTPQSGTFTTLQTSGNITANAGAYFIGDGSQLTNLPTQTATGAAGGDLTGTYPNPTLTTTGVSAGTYGNATVVPQFTVDSKGRVTAVSNVTITGTGGATFSGDLLGNTLQDSTRGRFFANSYPYTNPDSAGASNYNVVSTQPTYVGSVVQPPAVQQVVTGAFSANTPLQSAYGAGSSNRTTSATVSYHQVWPVTANTMSNLDRVRAASSILDVNLNGKTWGTMSAASQTTFGLLAQGGQTNVYGTGSASAGVGAAGVVIVTPTSGSANVQYATGFLGAINQVTTSNPSISSIQYARLLSGVVAGQSGNVTIVNAVGLHTFSGWVSGNTSLVQNAYAVLNEDNRTLIQTNGNVNITGNSTVNRGNFTVSGNVTMSGTTVTIIPTTTMGNLTLGGYYNPGKTYTTATTLTLDGSSAGRKPFQQVSLTADTSIYATALGVDVIYDFVIEQDASGGHTVTWYDVGPTATTSQYVNGSLNLAPYSATYARVIKTDSGHLIVNYSSDFGVGALGSQSGIISLNMINGSNQTMTLTGNITLNGSSINGLTQGRYLTLTLTQDGTGGRTLTSDMLFAGGNRTLSTGAGAIDTLNIYYDGTNYLAALVKGYT